MYVDPYITTCPKGVNKITYAVLQSLWWAEGYVSNFTVQTMGYRP